MHPAAAADASKYYQEKFPHDEVCTLLGRGWRGRDCLHKRELCIDTADDVKLRWLNCSSGEGLKQLFKKHRAVVFHNGAVYSDQPCFKKRGVAIQPVEREFVLDIDVNDYDKWGVNEDDLVECDHAWPVVAFGFRLVKHILRERYGFKHMLLVYSGRRGAHLSVYDARACAMDDGTRDAIISYLQPKECATEDNPRAGYKELLKATGFMSIVEKYAMPFWKNFCLLPRSKGGMGVLDGPFDKDAFMRIFGDSHAKATLTLNGLSGSDAWERLCKFANDSEFKDGKWTALYETVLCYVWPRLDAAVSKQRQHLSKSMFSIHAKTGRVCIPVFGDSMYFDPSKCPDHRELVQRTSTDADSLFADAVAGVRDFRQRMEKSSVERKWVKSSLDKVHSGVYSMLGEKRKSNADDLGSVVQCDLKRSRVCGDVVRVYSALASSANPDKVTLGFHSEMYKPSAGVIPAGYSLPFRASRTFPTDAFVRAVAAARECPGTEVVCDSAYVCVDFCLAEIGDLEACKSRMQRLSGAMSKRQSLCTVNAKWDEGAIKSMLSSQVKEHWDVRVIQMR